MSTSSIKTLNCLPALPADGKKKLSTLIKQHSGIFEVRQRKVGKGQTVEVRLREQTLGGIERGQVWVCLGVRIALREKNWGIDSGIFTFFWISWQFHANTTNISGTISWKQEWLIQILVVISTAKQGLALLLHTITLRGEAKWNEHGFHDFSPWPLFNEMLANWFFKLVQLRYSCWPHVRNGHFTNNILVWLYLN